MRPVSGGEAETLDKVLGRTHRAVKVLRCAPRVCGGKVFWQQEDNHPFSPESAEEPEGLPNCLKDQAAAKVYDKVGSENSSGSEEEKHIPVASLVSKPLAWSLETV